MPQLVVGYYRLALCWLTLTQWRWMREPYFWCGCIHRLPSGGVAVARHVCANARHTRCPGELACACAGWCTLSALPLPLTPPAPQALSRLPLLRRVTLGSLDVAPDSDYEDLMVALVTPERRTECTTALTLSTAAAAFGGFGVGAGDWEVEGSSPKGSKGGRGEGAGAGGGGTWQPGQLGAVTGMGSWRVLVLCGEQRAEALVAAGPLPRGLREVRVEQLRWPRWGWWVDGAAAKHYAMLPSALCPFKAHPREGILAVYRARVAQLFGSTPARTAFCHGLIAVPYNLSPYRLWAVAEYFTLPGSTALNSNRQPPNPQGHQRRPPPRPWPRHAACPGLRPVRPATCCRTAGAGAAAGGSHRQPLPRSSSSSREGGAGHVYYQQQQQCGE